MEQNEDLGHMNQNNEDASSTEERYYVPRHAVRKSSNSTSHTRVVLDGSWRSRNRICLNDILLLGPIMKQYLYSIVLRFRTCQITFTGNTAKMGRQVEMHQDVSNLLRILYLKSYKEPLRTYELATVRYGTASAPYITTRCLQQLAEYKSKDFSVAP